MLREEAIPAALRDGIWEGESAILSRSGEQPVQQILLAHAGPDDDEAYLSTIIRDRRHRRDSLRHAWWTDTLFRSLGRLADDLGTRPQHRKLPVFQGNRTLMVDLQEVVCLRADGHYTQVVTTGGTHLTSQTLSHVEQLLERGSFLRTHRSYVVNLDFIDAIERGDRQWEITLRGYDAERIPVSRRNTDLVRRALGLS